MPLLKLTVAEPLSAEQRASLLPALSKLVAAGIGKPEQYIMVTVAAGALLMSGQAGPAALVEVRSIGGLNGQVNKRLTRELCGLLEQTLHIPPARTYINFMSLAADHWGWNGATFG